MYHTLQTVATIWTKGAANWVKWRGAAVAERGSTATLHPIHGTGRTRPWIHGGTGVCKARFQSAASPCSRWPIASLMLYGFTNPVSLHAVYPCILGLREVWAQCISSPHGQHMAGIVMFLSCPLVKKHADLFDSFSLLTFDNEGYVSKPTNRTELSIPMTKTLRSHCINVQTKVGSGKGNNSNVPEQLDQVCSTAFEIYSDYVCLKASRETLTTIYSFLEQSSQGKQSLQQAWSSQARASAFWSVTVAVMAASVSFFWVWAWRITCVLCASNAIALTVALCTEASLTSACFTLAGKSFQMSALTVGTWTFGQLSGCRYLSYLFVHWLWALERLGQLSGRRDLSNLSLSYSQRALSQTFCWSFCHWVCHFVRGVLLKKRCCSVSFNKSSSWQSSDRASSWPAFIPPLQVSFLLRWGEARVLVHVHSSDPDPRSSHP